MSRFLNFCVVGFFITSTFAVTEPVFAEKKNETVLNHKVKSLEGKQVDLTSYEGKTVLVVNVASRCGATPQYAALQDVYENFKDDGLVVLGFPCNQFGKQEPGSSEAIREFCTANYGVSFPMMAKIDVNGDKADPFYKELKATETKPKKAGPVGWNFEKFLIGRDGDVVARFGTSTEPDSPEVIAAIKAELSKK